MRDMRSGKYTFHMYLYIKCILRYISRYIYVWIYVKKTLGMVFIKTKPTPHEF